MDTEYQSVPSQYHYLANCCEGRREWMFKPVMVGQGGSGSSPPTLLYFTAETNESYSLCNNHCLGKP